MGDRGDSEYHPSSYILHLLDPGVFKRGSVPPRCTLGSAILVQAPQLLRVGKIRKFTETLTRASRAPRARYETYDTLLPAAARQARARSVRGIRGYGASTESSDERY